jgi:glycosyltransferase involved in cell wall biosynthesis
LQPLRQQNCELIVVDGGSRDQTVALAEPLADRVIASPKGRAAQMNAGAAQARAPFSGSCTPTACLRRMRLI